MKINLVGKSFLGYTVGEKVSEDDLETVYKVIKEDGHNIRILNHITIPIENQYTSVMNSMDDDIIKVNNYFGKIISRFSRDISILSQLSEKGVKDIVRYYENKIMKTDSPHQYEIFIITEKLTPLEEYIRNNDLRVSDVIKMGMSILKGLDACHSNGIIHQDVNEKSIFVTEKGEFKIGNFRIFKALKNICQNNFLNKILSFDDVESYFEKDGHTKLSDLYSLGMVMYRLLNYGQNPFHLHFVKKFNIKGEKCAFEKFMSGKMFAFGGEQIGNVIVKAITKNKKSFQNSNEFIRALEKAVKNTSVDKLNENVKFIVNNKEKIVNESKYKDVEVLGVDILSLSNNELEHHNNLDKKVINKFVFLFLVVIILIGIIAYYIVIPSINSKNESIFESLFIVLGNIMDIRASSDTLFEINTKIGIRVFWKIWLSCLLFSLIFLYKRLHSKHNFTNAILKKKEPYLIIKGLSDILKQKKEQKNSKEFDRLIYRIKCIEEKLSVESDFGYGNDTVINCENTIAIQLKILLGVVQNIENENLEKNISALNIVISNINFLLGRRTELKRK